MTSADYHPRGQEVALWSDVLTSSVQGRGGLLTVGAVAGIGKTQLLTTLGAQAEERGLRVLRCAGRLLDRTTAHSATIQLFETIIARDNADLYVGAAAFARPLLEGRGSTGDLFAQTHALFWCLANLAGEGPIALLIDDAQWLDHSSAEFLGYLADRIDELPVAMVMAGRPAALQQNRILRVMGSRAQARCNLAPLTGEQMRSILADLLPQGDSATTDVIAALSGGNALLVHQLARAVVDNELTAEALETTVDGVLADQVRRRTAELAEPATKLLAAAAVLGDGTDWQRVGRVALLSASETAIALDDLRDGRLVLDQDGRVQFPHALVCEAVMEQIASYEQSALHRRASADLTAHGESDLAAAHLLHTNPHADPWVVDLLMKQAQIERERGAPDNAVTLLRRAMAEPPEPPAISKVTIALGEALLVSGEVSEAATLLGNAVRVAAGETRVAAARAAARALVFVGDPVGGVRLLEGISAELGAETPAGRQLRAELTGIGQTEHTLASLAHGEVGQVGFDHRAAAAMSAYDHLVVWEGRVEDQVELLTDVLPDAWDEVGIDSPLTGLLVTGLVVSGGPGWSVAATLIEEAHALARDQGSTVALATFTSLRSRLSFLQGRLREAQADGELAVELAMRSSPMVLPFAVSGLVMSLCASGRLTEADIVLEAHGYANGDVPPTGMGANLLLSRVMLRRAQGRVADAMADVARIEPFARGRARWPSSWTPEMVRALRAAGQVELATEIAADHVRDAEIWGSPLHLAEALLLRAECTSRIDDAEHALEILDGVPAVLTRAHILLALGSARRRTGQRTAAQPPLLDALELADSVACAPLIARVREELSASGLRPRRVAQTGVAALTASELRVTRLAAEGLSNLEIAQELYLSLKTIENHLTRAYAKLGVSSRRELSQAELSLRGQLS